MSQTEPGSSLSFGELLCNLFDKELMNRSIYNQRVVEITKSHLAVKSPHARAGNNLADDLIQLAKARAPGGEK